MARKPNRKRKLRASVTSLEMAVDLLDQCVTIGQREKLPRAVHLLFLAHLELRKAALERWSAGGSN